MKRSRDLIRRRAKIAGSAALLAALLALPRPSPAATSPLESRAFSYDVPVLAGSPWPEMRRDSRNTGESPIRGRYRGDRPWSFRTGRGIFSTPVIGDDGTVYIGSADGSFYALGTDGHQVWRFRTGGIIDAAAALGQRTGARGGFPITIGSGDETLYRLRSNPRRLPRNKRVRWRFRSPLAPATTQLVNWWEGNVAYGPDANLYVGNTGGGTYSLTPQGDQRWVVQRGNSVWTTPAFDRQGNSYWGSVDLYAFSLDPSGQQRWQTPFAGYVTSSPALGSDGTVYVGAFDDALHALDPDTGLVRWSFPTAAHIYGSPALAHDAQGNTSAIYVGSADGSVYAVRPDGSLIWRYDTGEPVRSSPVLGRTPNGDGEIVYVGSSNGMLYALDATTGARRWSFDTTPEGAALRDRNDLNGSPALGKRGVYIGGEHGRVWFIPYDYCRKRPDRRCQRSPGEEFGDELDNVFPVTPGGTTKRGASERVPAATVLGTRLVVRDGGVTRDARMLAGPTSDALVSSQPPFALQTQLSGDGHYLFIRPDGFLEPGTDYRVRVSGGWVDPLPGSFDSTLSFRTEAASRGEKLLLTVGRRRVDALEISRLALPLPSLLPSVNQIGFDSYDLLAGTLAKTKPGPDGVGEILMWVVAARRNGGHAATVDPNGKFAFALAGSYRGNLVLLNATRLNLQFSFGPVPVRSLDLRGQLESDGRFVPGSSLYGQVSCASVPNYSVYLYVAGVCNPNDTLAAYGTFLSDRYEDRGGANRRPKGVHLGELTLQPPTALDDGEAVARLELERGARYPAAKHLGSILLVDAETGTPVSLDYRALTQPITGRHGNLSEIHLKIPAATPLPPRIRAYVIADVFPLAVRELAGG
jgi:outer membrane protein assembly factor BamB